MGLFQEKLTAGNVPLWIDGRSGSFRDWSGNGRDATPYNGVSLNRDGFNFDGATGTRLEISSTGLKFEGATESFTVITRMKQPESAVTEYLMTCYDANDDFWRVISASGTPFASINTVDASGSSNKLDTNEFHHFAGVFNRIGDGYIIVDGEQDGASVDFTGQTMDLTSSVIAIGARSATDDPLKGIITYAVIINEVLTNSEINQISAELDAITWPSKVTSRKRQEFPFPSELSDADMEKSGTTDWVAQSSATLTKVTGNPSGGGSQALRIAYNGVSTPRAAQTIMTVGVNYRIRGWARGDGSYSPRLFEQGLTLWTGTTSTNWQYFDFNFIAGYARLDLGSTASAAGWAEFDEVQITEAGTSPAPEVWHTDFGATESVANVTAGSLEETPFQISTGTWKVSSDTINGEEVKVIECVSSGILYIQSSHFGNPTEAIYGTWDFWVNKSGGSNMVLLPAHSVIGGSAVGLNYNVIYRTDETLDCRRGGSVIIDGGATSYAASTWHNIKITRSSTGGFDVLMNGTSIGTVTDNTYTTSTYMVFDIDTGDKIALADRSGNHAIVKNLNVV